MQAINRPFTNIINGTTQFVIPVFQRDYSWTEEQCLRLWEDVVRIGSGGDLRGHFIGSLVYIPAGDTSAGFTRWLLIDGQQRLTTVTLLLLALRRHILDSGWQPETEDGPTAKRIEAYFLRNMQEEGSRRPKLVLRRLDQQTLDALLDGSATPTDSSPRILENYEFFRERVAKENPNVVYAGIGRLVVVDVTLDRINDDPQMIFESLNSTGVDLTQADLIRNYILMRVAEPQQTQLYEKYWQKIEDLFRGSGRIFDAFARDYMALKTQASKQARGDVIYHEFRTFFRGQESLLGVEGALEEMLRFARYHAAFSLSRRSSERLGPAMSRLNRLVEVAAIPVMRLSDLHDRAGTLSTDDFLEALLLLESYVFRRAVGGMQSRGYWQVLSALAYRISDTVPLLSLKVALYRQRESYRFPRDEEFSQALDDRNIYGMRIVHYLLDRLENHENKEPTDTSGYTVEHILPQNEKLSREWRDMLGADWQAVQQRMVHRLGNLTLTAYNSTYSDRSFNEKKTIKGGFDDSSVRLNKSVREQSKWTETEIQFRTNLLAKRALGIWPPLEVDEEAVRSAKQEDLKLQASKRSIQDVKMTAEAQKLFSILRPLILQLSDGVIEMPEAKSIVYHAADGDFFLEILPRKHRLDLLLNLDFAECDHLDERLTDATEKTFFINAMNSGGASYRIWKTDDVEGSLRYIRQAHELAAT